MRGFDEKKDALYLEYVQKLRVSKFILKEGERGRRQVYGEYLQKLRVLKELRLGEKEDQRQVMFGEKEILLAFGMEFNNGDLPYGW